MWVNFLRSTNVTQTPQEAWGGRQDDGSHRDQAESPETVTLFGKRVFAEVIQLRNLRLSWIFWVGPPQNAVITIPTGEGLRES